MLVKECRLRPLNEQKRTSKVPEGENTFTGSPMTYQEFTRSK